MATDGINKPTNQRPNYFPGQYLLEDDFQLEQQYHIDRQRWHHHLLHVSGIGEGLKIDKIENALAVKVSEGSAINPQGQQIILLNSQQIDLTKIVSNTNTTISDGTYTLYIGYKPKLTEQQTTGLDTSSRRWQEDPDFQLTSTSSELQNYVPLAKLTIKNNLVSEIDNSIRAYSGLRLPTIDGEITLRSKSDGTKSLAELNSSLSILGTLSVTGNIGIGIANPSEKLEVSGNIKATGSITSSSLTVTGNTRIKGTTKDNTAAGLNVTNSDSNSLFYVRNDGNIGIGTTNPSAKLEISGGDLKISGNISATNQSLSGNLSVTGNIGIGTTSTGTSKLKIANSASDFAHILFNGSGMGELQFIGWSSGWNINTITAGKHLYLNRDSGTNSNVLIGCNGKELFVRGSDGNVGIGTTTPTVKLEISGGDLKVSGNISATNATLSGNVRIGATNSTGAKLEIAIDPTSEDTVLKAGGVSGSKASIELSGHVQLKEYGTANLAFLQARDDGSNRDIGLRIRTQKAGTTQQQIIEALTILPNGNVSIGTTNTAAKLQVQIDDTTADASLKLEHNGSNFIVRPLSAGGNSSIIENTGGGSLIINPTGGNVGIGTTTPNRTLTIKADYSATADAQQLLIQGATNTNYQLLLGYHTTNNYGSIQAMNQTVGVRPLVLNPAGGNVGIGATTPGAKLTIQTLNDYDGSTLRLEAKKEPSLYYLNLNTSAGNSIVKWIFNQTNNGTNYPNVLAFDRGQIGIGTPTPLQTLDVNGRIHINNGVIQRGGDTAITNTSDLGLYSQVRDNWIRIVSTNGPIRFFSDSGTGSTWNMSIETNGNLAIRGTSSASNTASDIRLKNNLNPLTNVLEKLEKIRGISFEWNELSKPLGFSVGQREIGLIAQEVETEFPELVYDLKSHEYKAISYDKLAGVLVEAIKELKAKHDNFVQVQQIEIATLKAEITSLKLRSTQPA